MTVVEPEPGSKARPGSFDEPALRRRLLEGDREAAAALVEEAWPKVFKAMVRLSGDPALAEEITQEACRRAWQSLASFQGRSAFSTWLHTIARSTYLNHRRRAIRLVAIEEGDHPSHRPDLDGDLAERQRREALRQAILELPGKQRDVVVAHFYAELPVREIAAAEGISQQAVRKRLKTATVHLARVLEEMK